MKRSEQRESIFRLLYMKQFNSGEEMADQTAIYLQRLRNGEDGDPYDEPDDSADASGEAAGGQTRARRFAQVGLEDES